MTTRRQFLMTAAGAAAAVSLPGCIVYTTGSINDSPNTIERTKAVTRVYGDGMRLSAVAVEYKNPVSADGLDKKQYRVAGRNITDVYVSHTIGGEAGKTGRIVMVELNPYDDGALLVVKKGRDPNEPRGAGGGPGNAGDLKNSAPSLKAAEASITVNGQTLKTDGAVNLVYDEFKQFDYYDQSTGKTVRYNLFAPKRSLSGERYPLVLFMHDAGVSGKTTQAALYQGNGAISFATPEAQQSNPCFVLAPEYDEIIADDANRTSAYLDATINLIKKLAQDYPIDMLRLYTTGQSGGGMMSIAMNIKYPDFFAASYLVACQWDANLLTLDMARDNWWITVSEDDSKAYPGQTAIVDRMASFGAKTARAQWNAQWSAKEFQTAFDSIDAKHANINFVALSKGSVFKNAAEANAGGASGHTATWQYAYNIAPVRDWLFRHRKLG
ncbi:putative peptidase [Neisseria perflava]|uniref:Tat pathway signal protein n=1 Tax=Neisseria perflava TaxID=33053 RepID=UPI00209D461C|nr:Tat pathway signal protein [Neisseria perflava]MCP1772012.1 putative peptidase [Neisseria perflava]